jgi:L-lactate dehydrogenase complex protein LldG
LRQFYPVSPEKNWKESLAAETGLVGPWPADMPTSSHPHSGGIMSENHLQQFIDSAGRVGAEVRQMADLQEAVSYISEKAGGTTLVPATTLTARYDLHNLLSAAGIAVFTDDFRKAGHFVAAGVTFANFCLADSGTVVLESTAEAVRLATTLPEKHFILIDPASILGDNLAAAGPLRALHSGGAAKVIAYITGPSRTADIERVLTIGCHGPREVHILLVNGIAHDIMEN